MRRAALLAAAPLLAVLLLSACDAVPEPADAPEPAAPAAAAAEPARKAGPMQVWERGVGALGATTPFTAEAVRTAYPEADVQSAVFDFAENRQPMLVAFMEGASALEVFGEADGTVATMVVLGGSFRGPGGERLGQAWSETGFASSDCRPGEGRFLNNPICRRAPGSSVQVVFAVPGWTGPGLPPEARLREAATVSAFVWTQPAA